MTDQKKTKKHDISALETLYLDGKQCDSEIFSEMRSNLLLISGEHYARKNAAFNRRVRDSKDLNDQAKLRLTKNHIQNITKTYVNNIVSLAPGVTVSPKNENEIQDQKSAELNESVWKDAKDKYGIDELIDDWADDFVGIGEVATKIIWDPNSGPIKAFQQKLDDTGMPMVDEMGNMVKGDPIYMGEFVFDTIHGFNLLRAAEAKTMKSSPYLINLKMSDVDKVLAQFPDKEKFIKPSVDETMMVFDTAKNSYRRADKQVMIREYFFRPCPQYPEGYFYITTREGILAEGELPGGVFPIIHQHYDKVQTTPRGRGPVKVMRPFQAEINRAASKIAEHHVTLGDDKLLIQNGTKITPGNALPGVRSVNYTGMPPEVLPGRDGSQYLAYMQAQIQELYPVMNVAEMSQDNQTQLDPYVLLFRAANQKKKFNRYVKRFERFLTEVCRTYLKLAKIHLPDEMVIQAVSKREQVNLPEFRNSEELCYQIKLDAQSDDVETKLGKQLLLTQTLQYVGAKLGKEDIGKILRASPYANSEEAFGDMTLDYDNATNDILALDRGQRPIIHAYDDHVYIVKRLVSRMRQADFQYLAPQIQSAYAMLVQQHEQLEVERQQQIQAAEQGYIPTDGYMVTCDLYVADPADPAKTRRARLPYSALSWLIKRLETQGQSLEELENMNQGAVQQMANMSTGQQRGQPFDGMMGSQPQGAGMPEGVANGYASRSREPVGSY